MLSQYVSYPKKLKKMSRKAQHLNSMEVDASSFELEVLKCEQQVLVAFTAQWSRPCQIIESVLDEIASSCSEKLKVVWVNADKNPNLCLWYDIRCIPTLLCFVSGKVRDKVVGNTTKADILSKLEAVSNLDSVPGRHPDA